MSWWAAPLPSLKVAGPTVCRLYPVSWLKTGQGSVYPNENSDNLEMEWAIWLECYTRARRISGDRAGCGIALRPRTQNSPSVTERLVYSWYGLLGLL